MSSDIHNGDEVYQVILHDIYDDRITLGYPKTKAQAEAIVEKLKELQALLRENGGQGYMGEVRILSKRWEAAEGKFNFTGDVSTELF